MNPGIYNGSVPSVHVYSAFDWSSLLLSSPASAYPAGIGGRGRVVNWMSHSGGWHRSQKLRPTVLLAASSDLVLAACMAAGFMSTVT